MVVCDDKLCRDLEHFRTVINPGEGALFPATLVFYLNIEPEVKNVKSAIFNAIMQETIRKRNNELN